MQVLASNAPEELDLPYHGQDKLLLHAERWQRADAAHQPWAQIAKQAVDFAEGKQWTAEQIAQMEADKRPALTFNKIGRLVRLVLGYHRNNRTDLKVLPGYDGTGTQDIATVLTKTAKQISEINQLPYVDTEVFMDGYLTGRGYYDYRLNFEHNDFGEIKATAKDPFSIRLDPDGNTYDLNGSCIFLGEQRTVSIEEVEFNYGQTAAALMWPMVGRHGAYTGGIPNAVIERSEEVTPWRSFGGQEGGPNGPWFAGAEAYIANCFDRARKTIRLVDFQHQIWQKALHFVDLETGDRELVPKHFTPEDVQKVLYWAEQEYAKRGQLSPLRVQMRPAKRVRWTTIAGDIVVYDDWSAYETYTLVGFFPWFRRGKTKGGIEDLIDPQLEINKRRSATIDIITRTAHSGWLMHEKGMSEEQMEHVENNGAMPGVNIKWRGEQWQKPERISAAPPPTAMEKLEEKATSDLMEISGVNESALGDLDRVQSGRAIEARQRQAVLAIQVYMDNMSRSKELGGRKIIEMIQNHYTEERILRVKGDRGEFTFEKINERVAIGEIKNNVTLGRYEVALDETPLASSYLQAQFDELMEMVEKGVLPKELVTEDLIQSSSVANKEMLKRKVQVWNAALGIPSGEEILTPEGAGQITMAAATGALPPAGGPPQTPGPGGAASLVGGPPKAAQIGARQ